MSGQCLIVCLKLNSMARVLPLRSVAHADYFELQLPSIRAATKASLATWHMSNVLDARASRTDKPVLGQISFRRACTILVDTQTDLFAATVTLNLMASPEKPTIISPGCLGRPDLVTLRKEKGKRRLGTQMPTLPTKAY